MTDTLREAPPLVADGSLHELETPALLRRIAGVPARTNAAAPVIVEASVLHPELVPNDFVLVDFEVRPGVRNYRLVKLPANDPWRILIGAFERRVHRAFVVLARRLVQDFAVLAAHVRVPRAGVLLLLHGAPGNPPPATSTVLSEHALQSSFRSSSGDRSQSLRI